MNSAAHLTDAIPSTAELAAQSPAIPLVFPAVAQDPPESGDRIRRDSALIQRTLNGDRNAFMELVGPHEDSIFWSAMSILRNEEDAEECAQEAVLKAFAHLSSFRGNSSFKTWVTRIAHNEALMRRRTYRRARYTSLDEPVPSESGDLRLEITDHREAPAQSLEMNLLRNALNRAIEDLPKPYREVVQCRHVQSLSLEETAKLLGLTVAAVKTRLVRARKRLKATLAPAWGEGWKDCFREQPRTVLM